MSEKELEIPGGCSQGKEMGKKYGYWDYFNLPEEIQSTYKMKFENANPSEWIKHKSFVGEKAINNVLISGITGLIIGLGVGLFIGLTIKNLL